MLKSSQRRASRSRQREDRLRQEPRNEHVPQDPMDCWLMISGYGESSRRKRGEVHIEIDRLPHSVRVGGMAELLGRRADPQRARRAAQVQAA